MGADEPGRAGHHHRHSASSTRSSLAASTDQLIEGCGPVAGRVGGTAGVAALLPAGQRAAVPASSRVDLGKPKCSCHSAVDPPGGRVPHPRWTRPARALAITVGVLALVGSVAVLAPLVDGPVLAATWRTALGSPLGAGLALAAYLGAFLVRAALWQRVVPQLRLGHALAAIHLALAGNHLLPLRLGEALRVTSVLGLALLLAPSLVLGLFGAWGWAIVAALATAGIAGCWWLIRLSPGRRR